MVELARVPVADAAVTDRAGRDAPVLEARGVTKTFRSGIWPHRRWLPVLGGADVALAPGEIVGLVGENGSGKSTLMKILVGSLPRDAGSVTRSGQVVIARRSPSSTSA